MKFTAGHNMPGYLPESDPETFDTFDDAKRYMIEQMERDCDYYNNGDEHDLADELSGVEQDLNLDSGPEWGVTVGNVAYWIQVSEEEEEDQS